MTGTYNIWLQLLSFLVAVIASHVALDAASRVSSSSRELAKFWLVGGALSMGTGIWSMHFIGMLAFELPIPMSYDVSITLQSMLIAILASGFALFTINRDKLSLPRLLTSGLIMGIGIAAMHYRGMDAMQMSPPIRYDALLYGLSVLVAIAASIAALWISFNLRSDNVKHVAAKRMGAAVVMGIAIVGMHYTGMAAAIFAPGSVCLASPSPVGNLWMAATIAGCTLLFLLATMLVSVFDARLTSNTAKLARSLLSANERLTGEVEERKRAEAALQHSNAELIELKVAAETASRAKSEFLANVSHELRTPLTLILAPIEQLLAQDQAPGNWRTQLERVQRNASLLLNRVNDILDFSKVDADRLAIHLEAVNLQQLIPTLAGDAIPVAESKSCKLTCEIAPELATVCIDRSHFEKIFLNLLSNALKFTPAGGAIRVTAQAIDDDCFEFAVTDTGIGIPADKLSLLFNRFQQLDNSATRAHAGTGIGLALVKQLAEALGGSVGVASTPFEGSRFWVRLPRGSERLPALAHGGEDAATHALTTTETMLRHVRFGEGRGEAAPVLEGAVQAGLPTVLVVDDNPDMLQYIAELLAGQCNVLTAVNGRAAWDLLQGRHVDLVLSDVMMPELDGLGLTALIKGMPQFAHLPVILVTARGGTDASAAGLDMGADDYISKPFSPVELRARVRAVLRMAQVQVQLRDKSREAGMAIVATGVLHNLGNILNGVTISSGLIEEKLHKSKIPKLRKVAELLQEHSGDLPAFMSADSRGQVLPAFIAQLSEHLGSELSALFAEVEALRACTEHAIGIISTQQQFALPHSALIEVISANVLMDRALVLSRGAFAMRGVDVVCDFNCNASIAVDCNKVLQILLNLFANARHAVGERAQNDRRVWLATSQAGGRVRMEVRDNGVGIEARHLPQMFNQGFTTKSDGHGIGLHSSANWAHELGGTLSCHSDGINQGATFIFELAVAAQQTASNDAVSIAS
jgi:two-component system, sensor histidine kinase ChiS